MTGGGWDVGGWLLLKREHRQTGADGFARDGERTRTRGKKDGGGTTLKRGD